MLEAYKESKQTHWQCWQSSNYSIPPQTRVQPQLRSSDWVACSVRPLRLHMSWICYEYHGIHQTQLPSTPRINNENINKIQPFWVMILCWVVMLQKFQSRCWLQSKNKRTALDPTWSSYALLKHQLSTNQNNFISEKNLFISNVLRTSNLTAQNISYRILHFRKKTSSSCYML